MLRILFPFLGLVVGSAALACDTGSVSDAAWSWPATEGFLGEDDVPRRICDERVSQPTLFNRDTETYIAFEIEHIDLANGKVLTLFRPLRPLPWGMDLLLTGAGCDLEWSPGSFTVGPTESSFPTPPELTFVKPVGWLGACTLEGDDEEWMCGVDAVLEGETSLADVWQSPIGVEDGPFGLEEAGWTLMVSVDGGDPHVMLGSRTYIGGYNGVLEDSGDMSFYWVSPAGVTVPAKAFAFDAKDCPTVDSKKGCARDSGNSGLGWMVMMAMVLVFRRHRTAAIR